MTENQEQIERLQAQLDRLVRTQIDFQKEVTSIRAELDRLRAPVAASPVTPIVPEEPVDQAEPPAEPTAKAETPQERPPAIRRPTPVFTPSSIFPEKEREWVRSDLEKFIGENLIAKIGIIILVLGVGIGTKYAIDNGWISPLLRIVMGYVIGFVLVGLADRLKEKYHNFSAVLLSGGMAVMYFVTYFAYAFYSLMPQAAAFALMAIFTAFTVLAAIIYRRQVIAHIGLVGAYAVPFLLSDNSGNYPFLFSYMAIVNGGILAIAVAKQWRAIFYTSSVFTWLIFYAWFAVKYSPADHFYLALGFLGLFFAIFYVMKVIHGVVHDEHGDHENLIAAIGTTVIFYAFCLGISDVSAGSREYAVLFGYLAFFAAVILYTSFRYYGRLLVYVAYPFTWLIYGIWFINRYKQDEHALIGAAAITVFFAIFYISTIYYRTADDEAGMPESTTLLLTNSFAFYGFGYGIMDSRESTRDLEGLFTAAHGALHLVVAQILGRIRSTPSDIVQVLTILVITFATIAVPVQFDGNVVTLIWSVEAAVLFWYGRSRVVTMFEYFSYPVMLLATISLFNDWGTSFTERLMYNPEFSVRPIVNGDFVTALVFVAAFAFIYVVNKDPKYRPEVDAGLARLFGLAVGALGIFVLYNTFRIEIANYFHIQALSAGIRQPVSSLVESTLTGEHDIIRFNVVWQINYTMFFLTALAIANLRKVRSVILAFAGSGIGAMTLIVFATLAMYLFYLLRVSYLAGDPALAYHAGPMNIVIRYISYLVAAGLIITIYLGVKDDELTGKISSGKREFAFDALLYVTSLVVASCELVNIMAQLYIADSDKLGLSVLWGAFALMMVVVGIAWKKKHLRIAAILLLAATLVKLFIYDVADLPTIPKTILFVSLGVLLLVVSFLYNKFAVRIFNRPAEDTE